MRVSKGDGPFKPVVVVAVVIGGRVGPVKAQQFRQLDHEELVISMLAPAGVFPTGDEGVDLRGVAACYERSWCAAGARNHGGTA